MKFIEKTVPILSLDNYEIVSKYDYQQFSRAEDPATGKRMYAVEGKRLPSVTTILSATKDQSALDAWKKRVGAEEAERIKNEASAIGTEMHLVIEKYLQGEDYLNSSAIGNKAREMAHVVLRNCEDITEVWGNEISLAYPEKYAGATDLVAVANDKPTIFDWKQTNKPKRKEWIEDYYLQLAAYSLAHGAMYGEVEAACIRMCSRNYEFQEFKIEGQELKDYQEKWWERYEKYLALV
jgi:hypothetical protein